jgi:starch-binding outer membrane protein, SusD/RagB family
VNRIFRRLAPGLALVAATAGCNDFITGGELTNDPNRALAATSQQLFTGIQSNIWAALLSAPNRYAGLWTQQFVGGGIQYTPIYEYERDESLTNGLYTGLYTTGGLIDIRQLQRQTLASRDSLFLGIAQVQEAITAGTGADFFGDIAYKGIFTGERNVPLTPQMEVYDSVQALLSRAITNMSATGPTNVGPGSADLAYNGNRQKWIRLAHTLKARYFLHTAEVRGAPAYQSALAEARQGITNPADNWVAVFSGASGEQNFFFQFQSVRAGYYTPNTFFVNLLKQRNDPRLADYFNSDQSDLSDERLAADYTQPLVTANENLLIWAEAAQRTGNEPDARTQLNAERTIAGLPAVAGSLSGNALLAEILTEKYISNFGSIEVWNDYKRTCFPNLTPTVAGEKIPGRLYYDTNERTTNTTIPDPNSQPFRNANDPANKTSDGTSQACLGQ